jgi:hypothetical protein
MSLSLRRIIGNTEFHGVTSKVFASTESNPSFFVHPGNVVVIRTSDEGRMAYLLVIELR